MNRIAFTSTYLVVLLVVLANGESPILPDQHWVVLTEAGPIRGKLFSSDMGSDVWKFLSIPFARPPVGDLRFKRPVPPIPWDDIKDVWDLPNRCAQKDKTPEQIANGLRFGYVRTDNSEDCLYLGVYVPERQVTGPLPVMVWVHGGGFVEGGASINLYDATNIVAHNDVIVVAIQYRLGPFGFLYLGNDDAPGNQGLLDQTMAFRWVRKNIGHFGGDPQKITVFGESAGSESVGLHLFNTESSSLFDRVILQSGSPVSEWAYFAPDKIMHNSKQLLKAVSCDLDNETDLNCDEKTQRTIFSAKRMASEDSKCKQLSKSIECLRKLSTEDVLNSVMKFDDPNDFMYMPTLDNYFLTKHPVELFIHGSFSRKHLLVGTDENEGLFFAVEGFGQLFDLKKRELYITEQQYLGVVEAILADHQGDPKIIALASQYKKWSEKDGKVNYIEAIDKLIADAFFICPSLIWAYENSEQYPNNTFYYHFNYRESTTSSPKWTGVMHGYELPILFGNTLDESIGFNDLDTFTSRRMMKYWVNFATTGDPNTGDNTLDTPYWEPVGENPDIKNYIEINPQDWKNSVNYRSEQCQYWYETDILFPDCCKRPLRIQPQMLQEPQRKQEL